MISNLKSRKNTFIFCLSLVFSSFLMAQEYPVYTVKSIDFKDVKHHKPRFLYRVIKSRVGGELQSETLKKDVRLLKQLNGIAQASYVLDTVGNQVSVTFEMEETITLFPIVNFGGVSNNFWFQLGLTETNLFGRGHQASLLYMNNDNRHNANAYYRLPFIRGSRWGTSFSVVRWASLEPIYFDDALVFYNLNNNSYSTSLFYQFRNNHFIEFGATYFNEKFEKAPRHAEEITPGPERVEQPKSLFKLTYQINDLDYHYFYLQGLFFQTYAETVLNIDDRSRFNLWSSDLLYFKRVGKKGNLAWRLRLGLSTNSENPFAPFVLDSQTNIRGSGNRIDRGTAVIVLNSEYRHAVFESKRYAAQLVAFSDLGTWRLPGGPWRDLTDSENFRHFVGGGFRLIYKRAFNSMIRVDYGVDTYDINQRGWVVGFGQYF